jgi:hypothetical protein
VRRWFWAWFVDDEATYVEDIQVLAPDKPLTLPPVKPLKGRTETNEDRAARRRQDERISDWWARAKQRHG